VDEKEIKSDLFHLRKKLLKDDSTDKDYALNMALQYIQHPSSETLKWVRYYLEKHINNGTRS